MSEYWFRQRFIHTLILSVAAGLATALLFVFPYISRKASDYNAQSIYKNSDVDFVAPEPSFDQVRKLPGSNGIKSIFPFYLTKTEVSVNGKTRTTTVLLSDDLNNHESTMYNDKRIIEKLSSDVEKPILVDWEFCHDTGAKLGDAVTFSLGETNVEYVISSVYETNTIYDGGAILAGITDDQKQLIMNNSKNSGYSSMYITASNYQKCQSYLTTEYRPLGRLKDKSQFSDEKQYQTHYDAIMSSGFANEITDFRVRESSFNKKVSPLMVGLGGVFVVVLSFLFNILMAGRGCERVYFTKSCIPKGQNVRPYYVISFIAEIFLFLAVYTAAIMCKISASDKFIPKSALNVGVVLIPAALIIVGIINLRLNFKKVDEYVKTVEREKKEREERERLEREKQQVQSKNLIL